MKKFIAALFLVGCSHTSAPIKQAETPKEIQSGPEVCTLISSSKSDNITLYDYDCNNKAVWWHQKVWKKDPIEQSYYIYMLEFFGKENCYRTAVMCQYKPNEVTCVNLPVFFLGYSKCKE